MAKGRFIGSYLGQYLDGNIFKKIRISANKEMSFGETKTRES